MYFMASKVPTTTLKGDEDPLLSLANSGKKIWRDEHADDYVRRLREGWNSTPASTGDVSDDDGRTPAGS